MAKLAALIDDFQDGVINPSLWTATGPVSESGGRIHITPNTSYPLLSSLTTYDMTESQIVARIAATTSNGSTGTLESTLLIQDALTNRAGIRKQGSNLQCIKYVGGVFTTVYTTAYNPSLHVFWRMRESGGLFYWDVSAAGTSWTNLFNTTVATNLFPVNNVVAGMYAGWVSGVEAFPGTFQIEDVNPGLLITASGASTSSGSLAILKVSPLEITGAATSTSTGTLAWTILPAATLHISFSGASTSAGSFSPFILASGQLTGSATSTSSGSLILQAITPVPPEMPAGTWYFEPPIAYDLPPTLPEPTRPRWINAHAKWKGGQRRGRSVLKIDGEYVIVDTPTVDQMAAADIAYQGGHVYEITVEEAYALHLAGFNVYHGTDLLTTEDGDLITTESGDILQVEYSFGSS